MLDEPNPQGEGTKQHNTQDDFTDFHDLQEEAQYQSEEGNAAADLESLELLRRCAQLGLLGRRLTARVNVAHEIMGTS